MGWFDDLVEVGEDWGHTALTFAGMVPVIGNIADLANAGWYLAEGDRAMAALSAAAAIPGAGLAFGGGKLALGAGKAAKTADTAYRTAQQTAKTTRAALDKAAKLTSKASTKAAKTSSAVEKGRKAVTKANKALKKAKKLADPKKIAAAKAALKSKKQLLSQASKAHTKVSKAQSAAKATYDTAGKAHGSAVSTRLTTAARGKGASQFAATPLTRRFIGSTTTPGKLGRFFGGGTGTMKVANVVAAYAGLSPAQRRDAAIQEWRGMTPEEQDEYDSKKDFLQTQKDDYERLQDHIDDFDDLPNKEKLKYKGGVDEYVQQQEGGGTPEPTVEPTTVTPPKPKGLLPEDEPGAKKGARKKRKEEAAEAERKEARRAQRREDDRYKFDKRMALEEARLGRKEERKAASAIDEKHALADEMLNSMGDEPDFFKNNPIEKGLYWKRARKLGVTADQFNNYINRNYKEGQRLHRQREYERDSAEGRAWLNEKLDQPSLGQMGIPTPSARGRNIGRFKTGEVSPTKTEVRESVRESDEDERKKERRRDRGRKKIEGRGDKRRGKRRDEEKRDRGGRGGRGGRAQGDVPQLNQHGLLPIRNQTSPHTRGAIGKDRQGNIIFPFGDIRNDQMMVRRESGPGVIPSRIGVISETGGGKPVTMPAYDSDGNRIRKRGRKSRSARR